MLRKEGLKREYRIGSVLGFIKEKRFMVVIMKFNNKNESLYLMTLSSIYSIW